MGGDSDDLVSLPVPPPPRPAARREAIDAALRRFDGIEDAPAARDRPRRIQWASLNRRPAGALAAAAIIAVVSIPAIQIALRDRPPEASEQAAPPAVIQPGQPAPARPGPAVPGPNPQLPQLQADEVAPAVAAPVIAQPAPALATAAAERREQAFDRASQKAVAPPAPGYYVPAPPPVMAAPPPPPPPPPAVARQAPAEPEADASDVGSIVVTGGRVRRPNLESSSPISVVSSAEIQADAYAGFLSRLQDLIDRNDRESVAKLVALPFRVTIDGKRRTYTSSRDIYRDYELIFTPAVRTSDLSPNAFKTRAGGRLRGNGRISIGCGKTVCASEDGIRIREIVP